MAKKTEWTTISIPKDFKEECKKFLDRHPGYYPSFAEFVRAACRRLLESLIDHEESQRSIS